MNIIRRTANAIENISEWTGRLTAWLVLAMVLLISYDVAMRYIFNSGSVALQELEWHLFALVFLLGAGYTLRHDEHVRVDIFYRAARLNDRHRALIDLFGGLFFLLPFGLAIIVSAWPFVHNAYLYSEGSPDPGGLPYRWILKAGILAGFGLLLLQGIADIIRNLLKVIGRA